MFKGAGMSELIFTGFGDAAADRLVVDRARRYEALSEAGKRTDRTGEPVRRIVERVYTTNLRDPVEEILRRNAWKVLGKLYPGLVISGRSAASNRTVAPEGEKGPHFAFLTGPYRRNVTLPGMEVRIAKGPGALPGDVPFLGLYVSSHERQCLENLMPSRDRRGVSRTTGPGFVEGFLARMHQSNGPEAIEGLLERARAIKGELGAEQAFEQLDALVGAMLRRRDPSVLTTPAGRALSRSEAVDQGCAQRLNDLFAYLSSNPMPDRPDLGMGRQAATNTAFVEAYFSNYIEGTTFLPAEAREIVFGNGIDPRRHEDGHDVLATFRMLADYENMRRTPDGFDAFLATLTSRHALLMGARPETRPGEFKERANRAGNTIFVAPDAVKGTLRHGHELLQGLVHPFARAAFVHYLVSEVHPFDDGNGRLSRIMMANELTAGGQARVVVPTVFRDDYIAGQRAMSRNNNPGANFRALDRCQGVTARIVEDDLDACIARWASTHAFCEPGADARLTDPTDEPPVYRNGTPAPASYWEAIDNPVDIFGNAGNGPMRKI